MPATVTLASTTLAATVPDSGTTRIKLTSTAGVYGGQCLYMDGELMGVVRIDVDPWVIVSRGIAGSKASPHSSGVVVYIGRADQFYAVPPVGRPDGSVLVSPYIDAMAGIVYFAQGDTTPSGTAVRWWTAQTNTRTSGPLGVTTSTLDPTSST